MYILDIETERFNELYDMIKNDHAYYEDEFLRLVQIPTEARSEIEWEYVVDKYEYASELLDVFYDARERKENMV